MIHVDNIDNKQLIVNETLVTMVKYFGLFYSGND